MRGEAVQKKAHPLSPGGYGPFLEWKARRFEIDAIAIPASSEKRAGLEISVVDTGGDIGLLVKSPK